jgi:hypothetical protein
MLCGLVSLFVGLLARVNEVFGFPVMGQSPRFLARASMTGIPFIPMNRVASGYSRKASHG